MSSIRYMPNNILVTGGAGFIGSNFIRHYLSVSETANIINLDCLTYAGSLKNVENLSSPSRHHFIQGNICDAALVKKIVSDFEIDTIIHFAAESHVDRSIENPLDFIQTNIVGTSVLLEAARQYWLAEKKWDAARCRFHHISTDEVYGSLSKNDPAFTEKTPYAPRSPYSASKASSDHFVHAYFHTYQLPITISHCSNNYGPYQHTEKWIPTIITSCLTAKPIPVYGKGENIRDWLYVEDHCRGIASVLHQGKIGESYHFGGETEWDNLSLAKYICEQFDVLFPAKKPHASLIQFVQDRKGHDWRYAMDISKSSRELGFRPMESFESGVRKTIGFYIKQK